MELGWIGHACFRLRDVDMVVITDPFPASLGLRPDVRPASVVTVSNTHPNHCAWEEVPGSPKVFNAPGEYEYNGVSARGVMTPIPEGTPRDQRNVAFTIEIDNVNICHLGDIASPLTTQQVDELKPVDVLLAPTGGRCTLNMDQVFQTFQDLDPKILVPMHHETPGVPVPLDGLDVFVRRMGLEEPTAVSRLTVTRSNLPTDMRIVIMGAQARLLGGV